MKKHTPAAALAFLLATTLSSHATTFESWRALFFTTEQLTDSAVSGPEADPDSDGVGNFSEFVLGTDPWVPAAEPLLVPQFTLDQSTNFYHFAARFRVAVGPVGTMVLPQVTEHLGTRWRADKISLFGIGYHTDGRYEFFAKDSEPFGLPEHRFIRLLIAADANENGMPDDWELAMGMDINDPFGAMVDSDGDGDSNYTEFLHGTNPLDPNDNSRQDEIPRAPREVKIVTNSDGTRDVVWTDVSNNETFFVIYGTNAAGVKVELGRVGTNLTRFRLPAGY